MNCRTVFPRLALSFVLGLFCAGTAAAATRTVTTNTDLGAGSLRQAIADSTSGDTILFALPSGSETITLGSELAISGKSLTVDGANTVVAGGSGTAVTITVPVPGTSPHRVFYLAPGTGNTVALSHLTLCGGSVAGIGLAGKGGVILCNGGALGLDTVTLRDGRAAYGGGLAVEFGAVATLTNCTISGNSAVAGGGLLVNGGTATLTQTTVSGNSATSNGGGLIVVGTATLTQTTVSGNSATYSGGGLYVDRDGTATLTQTTVSGNSATRDGGGLYVDLDGTATLTQTTVSGNSATQSGGGLIVYGGTATLLDTIAIANTAPWGGDDLYIVGTLRAYASWYAGTYGSIATDPVAPNLTTAYTAGDLGALADNGGPTQTHALARTAPAVGAGVLCYRNATDGLYFKGTDALYYKVAADGTLSSFTPSASQLTADRLATDQRGVERNAPVDLGAFQLVRVATAAAPAAGTYKAGATLSFTVTFSDTVAVSTTGGTPRLVLTIGAATRYATYDAAASTDTSLVFTYTVAAGDTDADGLAVASPTIDLNGGTLTDAGGCPVVLALPAYTLPTIRVDTTAPAVATIARTQPGPVTLADTLEWRVTFTEAVAGVDAADFALTPVDGAATATLGTVTAGASAAEYFVTATGVAGVGTLRLDVKASGTGIVDGSANALAAGFTLGQPYTHALGTVPVAWGDNYSGQFGLGSADGAAHPVPALVPRTGALAGKTVVAVAAAGAHSLALCSDGTVAAWGWNSYGQLGNGLTVDSPTPVAVNTSGALAGKKVVALAAGHGYSLALCSDGTVAAWGGNSAGQLGNGSTVDSSTPVAVDTSGALAGKTVVAVAAGLEHSLALCRDGTVAAWGGGYNGQLGNPSLGSPYSSTPVAVDVSGALAGKTVVALAAGCAHSLALCSDSQVYAWGRNDYGQLGDTTTTNSSRPVAVDTSGALAGKTVVAVAAGNEHSLALDSEGQVVAWGYNSAGQLGNPSLGSFDSATPVAVSTAATSALAGKAVVALAAGEAHSLALDSEGQVVAWGYNYFGQLGNGSTGDSSTPVAVNTAAPSALVGRTVYALASGCWAGHSLALASPAAITTVATPAAGAYKAGDTLTFTLTLDGAATVDTTGGTPRLALTIGAATRYATYDAASSTGTSLVFTSTVQAGDTDADGLAVAGAIDLNGGTLTDVGGWPVALALPAYPLPTIRVDTTAPALSVVTLLSDNAHDAALAKAGDTIALSFRANETLQTPTVTLAGESATANFDSGTNTWTATRTVAAGDAEGAVTFAIVFSDVAGNAGTAVAATTDSSAVTIDLTAPETTIDSAPGAWTGPLVMFEFAGEDGAGSGVASYEVSVNGAAFAPATFREFFSDLPDGPYLLAVRAIDAAGNVDATPAEHRWTVDTLKPTLTAVTLVSRNAAPTLAKAGDTVTLSFRASEMLQTPTVTLAGESVTASYDSGTSTWTATHTVAAGDTEGAVTISIAYRDESGLAGTTVTATTDGSAVTIDLTAPETTIAAQPANPSGSASATFTFGSTDATASFEASLDGAAYAAATSPATFTGLADGPHTFAVRAIDSAGNVDATPASYAWTVATVFTAPVPDGFGASATGGAAGPSVVATTAAEFATYATSADAQVITVVGTLDIGTVAVGSNKTIQGADASATLDGCLSLTNVSNIVIRGLNLANPDGTALRLSGARRVYVTRCSFLDSAAPQFVATGSDQLTVSWCEFAAIVAGQSAVQLGAAGEVTTPRITLHHNWWSANLASALPAAASGQVHQYSNYLDVTGNTTGTAVSGSAQLLSEANVYVGTANPLAKAAPARIRVLDNTYTDSPGTTDAGTDPVFTPSYSYTLLDRSDLATLLRAQAGNVSGARYTEEPVATASITATATTVVPGAGATLTASITGATAAGHQWRLDNAPISGATGATYTVSGMAAAHAGTYTVAVSLANGDTVVSTPTTLILGTPPPPPPTPTPSPAKGGGGACGPLFVLALGLLAALRRRRA